MQGFLCQYQLLCTHQCWGNELKKVHDTKKLPWCSGKQYNDDFISNKMHMKVILITWWLQPREILYTVNFNESHAAFLFSRGINLVTNLACVPSKRLAALSSNHIREPLKGNGVFAWKKLVLRSNMILSAPIVAVGRQTQIRSLCLHKSPPWAG